MHFWKNWFQIITAVTSFCLTYLILLCPVLCFDKLVKVSENT